jgi:3-oxoacyl-[acyl-carrier-protein] synthase-3
VNVPSAMKIAMDKSGIPADQLKKIIIHQANEKMDEAIVNRFIRQCKLNYNISGVMPMSINELGNSSVATIPTLYDLILKNKIDNHTVSKGDINYVCLGWCRMNIMRLFNKN